MYRINTGEFDTCYKKVFSYGVRTENEFLCTASVKKCYACGKTLPCEINTCNMYFLLQLKKLHQKQLLHIIFEQNFDQTEIYCNKKILYRQNILTRSLTIVVGDREVNDLLVMNYLSTGEDGFDICYADVVMCISGQLRLFYSF